MPKMTKRADGRYCINVYIGTVSGVTRYKSVYGKSPKEVNEKAAKVRADYNNGIGVLSGDNKSFDFWAQAFLKKQETTAAPEWYKILKARTEQWQEFFKGANITDIHTSDCDEFIIQLAKENPFTHKPSSRKTLAEYVNVLSRIFEYCLYNRVLTFNPARYITLPQNAPKRAEKRPLSDTEINYFWATEHPLQTVCLISIYAGLRKGELSALTWKDIDFKRNTITVNKSVNFKRDGEIKPPKTSAGNRIVPMPKVLAEYLKGVKKDGLLVLSENGLPYNAHKWEKRFNQYLKKISKEQGVNFTTSIHCLRHTYCTLLYEAGVDVMTAKEYMGHSDILTTTKTYTHLRKEKEMQNIVKLDNYISGTFSKDEKSSISQMLVKSASSP